MSEISQVVAFFLISMFTLAANNLCIVKACSIIMHHSVYHLLITHIGAFMSNMPIDFILLYNMV